MSRGLGGSDADHNTYDHADCNTFGIAKRVAYGHYDTNSDAHTRAGPNASVGIASAWLVGTR